MPAGMVRTQGGCGGSVGPRRYDHERGWSPFRPVQCLAAGVDESPEPTHRNSEPGVTIITRTPDNSNRKQTSYIDRKSGGEGKRVSVRVVLGGRRIIKKK